MTRILALPAPPVKFGEPDWATLMTVYAEHGTMFPEGDEAPELPDHFDFDPATDLEPAFTPTADDWAWLDSRTREGGAA